jgi:hypothetical protein
MYFLAITTWESKPSDMPLTSLCSDGAQLHTGESDSNVNVAPFDPFSADASNPFSSSSSAAAAIDPFAASFSTGPASFDPFSAQPAADPFAPNSDLFAVNHTPFGATSDPFAAAAPSVSKGNKFDRAFKNDSPRDEVEEAFVTHDDEDFVQGTATPPTTKRFLPAGVELVEDDDDDVQNQGTLRSNLST